MAGILNLSLATEAGVTKKVKTGDSPLRIYDNRHSVDAAEAVGPNVIRTKNRIKSVAGVLRRDPVMTISKANPY